MDNYGKYIKFDHGGRGGVFENLVLFATGFEHSEVNALLRNNSGKEGWLVQSAGFVRYDELNGLFCYGRSTTLGIAAADGDEALLVRMLTKAPAAKYIMVPNPNLGIPSPFVFNGAFDHATIARLINLPPSSAGFTRYYDDHMDTWGESVSLNLQAQRADTVVMQNTFDGNDD